MAQLDICWYRGKSFGESFLEILLRIYWFSPYLGSGDNKQLGNKHEPGDGYKVFEHPNNADRGWNSYEVYELIIDFVNSSLTL